MKISQILSEEQRKDEITLDGEVEKLADAGDISLDGLLRHIELMGYLGVCLALVPFHFPDGACSVRHCFQCGTDDGRYIFYIYICESRIKNRNIEGILQSFRLDASEIVQGAVLYGNEKVCADGFAYIDAVRVLPDEDKKIHNDIFCIHLVFQYLESILAQRRAEIFKEGAERIRLPLPEIIP